MTLTKVNLYFILLNTLSFGVLGLDSFLRSRKKQGLPLSVCILFSAVGGSVGALLAEFIWDRVSLRGAGTSTAKSRRDACLCRQILSGLFLLIHLPVYLFLTGTLRLDYWHFPTLTANGILFLKYFFGFVLLMNLISFLLFFIDKQLSKQKGRRISILTLFICALLGGSLGALCGMWFFRHKTQKLYFRYGLPLLLFIQTAAAILLLPLSEKLH